MKRSLILSVAALGFVAASSTAFAADLVLDEPMVIADAPSGSFEGLYLGIFGTAYPTPSQYGGGVELGYNLLPAENVLLGVEVSGALFATGYDPEVWLKGKLGFTADTFAIYGFGEVGGYFGGGGFQPQYGLGAGAEVFVTESLSLDGEVGMRADIGNSLSNLHAQIGLRFHF